MNRYLKETYQKQLYQDSIKDINNDSVITYSFDKCLTNIKLKSQIL